MSYNPYTVHQSYSAGLDKESLIIKYLEDLGFDVEESTGYENRSLDIDCYVFGDAVSIKAIHNHSRIVDNMGFEMYQFKDNVWEPTGWFYTGEADYYVVWHKNGDVMKYSKVKVKALLEAGNLRTVYKTQLSESTCIQQAAIGHSVIDAELQYVKIKELINEGAAVKLGNLPFEGMVNYSLTPHKKDGNCV